MYTRDAAREFLPQSSGVKLSPLTWYVMLAAVHAALGVLAARYWLVLAEVHAYACVAIGLYFAVTRVPLWHVLAVCCYIAASEVWWRMLYLPIRWEHGKLVVIAICVAAIVRRGMVRLPVLPAIYVLLLVPSVFLIETSPTLLDLARSFINGLAGPFALWAVAWVCAHCQMTTRNLWMMLLVAGLPGFAYVARIASYFASRSHVVFIAESNFATSGGFGPNQVAAGLALVAVLTWFARALSPPQSKMLRWLTLGAVVVFTSAAIFTFSRTGVYLIVIAWVVSGAFLLRNPRTRVAVLGGFAITVALFVFVVFPALDQFTGGMLSLRYSEATDDRRTNIMAHQLEMWAENPLFGVGPGNADYEKYSSHTEYTRMVAEHGWLGLMSMIALFGIPIVAMQRRRHVSTATRGVVIGLAAFGFAYMIPSAMRMVAPSVCIGLCYLTCTDGPEDYLPGHAPVFGSPALLPPMPRAAPRPPART